MTANEVAENAAFKLFARGSMAFSAPAMLALLYWNFSSVQELREVNVGLQTRVQALEIASAEERRQIAEARVRRDVQYADVVTKLATVDERVRGLSDTVGRFLTLIEKRTELLSPKASARP